MKNKIDIQYPKDVKLFVDAFYKKVLQDDILKVNFTDIDWKHYLPFTYRFIENITFHWEAYSSNQMLLHKDIHQIPSLSHTHLEYCIDYFNASVDAYFEGIIANTVKQRAQNIVDILKSITE